MEKYQDLRVRNIAMCFSAQSGKTMTELACLAYSIEEDPGATGFILPSQDFAISFSNQRLQPLLDYSPQLAAHKLASRHKYKNLEMTLDCMTIFVMWAGSATQMASRAIKNMFRDEVDKWPSATDREADPMSLSDERTKTYRHQKKVVDSSTPTNETGNIWRKLNEYDFREYYVPCPKCSHRFVIDWECIRWEPSDDENEVRASTYCLCKNCGEKIGEQHKHRMLSDGKWDPRYRGKDVSKVSYHLSEMYSPWTTWGDLAVKFRKATSDAKIGLLDSLQNFTNSSLAETWESPVANQKHDEDIIRLKDDRPMGMVPKGTLLITAGVDTQDNGTYFVIRAWGEDMSSWLVRYGFVDSLPALDKVLFEDSYRDSEGTNYIINLTIMDAMGHRTAEIYDYCRTRPGMLAAKGERSMTAPHKITKIDTYPGTTDAIPGGVNLIRHNTNYFKDMLAAKMMIAPCDPGAYVMNSDIDTDFIKQMTSEYKDEKGIWCCPKGRANHYWDCEELTLLGADFQGARYMRKAESIPAKEVEKQVRHKRAAGKKQNSGMMY